MSVRVPRSHGWSITALDREFGWNSRTVKRKVGAEEPRQYSEQERPTALTRVKLAHFQRRREDSPHMRGTIVYYISVADEGSADAIYRLPTAAMNGSGLGGGLRAPGHGRDRPPNAGDIGCLGRSPMGTHRRVGLGCGDPATQSADGLLAVSHFRPPPEPATWLPVARGRGRRGHPALLHFNNLDPSWNIGSCALTQGHSI